MHRWGGMAHSRLFGAILAGLAALSAASEEVECQVEAENRWARLQPLEGPSAFNISNVTEQVVLDLVLYVDRAEVLLPNGVVLRVSTAEALEFDLSIDGLTDMQQSLWEIMAGNMLGTLICCALLGVTVFLEKKFQCIGGEKLHELADKQERLHEDLEHATNFLKLVQEDPTKLHGRARVLAMAYQATVAADGATKDIDKLLEAVRAPPLPAA